MNRTFFFGGNAPQTHAVATELGFKRGEYTIVVDAQSHYMRGLKDETLFVVGTADVRDDYHKVVNDALSRDFTVIYIDSEIMDVIAGV